MAKSKICITYEDAISTFKAAVVTLSKNVATFAATNADFADHWAAMSSVIENNMNLLKDRVQDIDLTNAELTTKEQDELGLNEAREVMRSRACHHQIWAFGAIAIKFLGLVKVVDKKQARDFVKQFRKQLVVPTMDLAQLWLQMDTTLDTPHHFRHILHEAGTGGVARDCKSIYANIATIVSAFSQFEIKHTPGLVPRVPRSLRSTIAFLRNHWCRRTRLEFNVRLHHSIRTNCDEGRAITPTTVMSTTQFAAAQ